jgi:hypothetical protein
MGEVPESEHTRLRRADFFARRRASVPANADVGGPRMSREPPTRMP